jgi:outer membrane usher protein FimD/PapC
MKPVQRRRPELYFPETVPPGEYNLDVYINDEFIASESISFTQQRKIVTLLHPVSASRI